MQQLSILLMERCYMISWILNTEAAFLLNKGYPWQVLQALCIHGHLEKEKSVLIHDGTGDIGLAAILICLHYECTIFVTVDDMKKRQFLKKIFPSVSFFFTLLLCKVIFFFWVVVTLNQCHVVPFYYTFIRSLSLGVPFDMFFRYRWCFLCFLPTSVVKKIDTDR